MKGQAVLEYILVTAIIVGIMVLAMGRWRNQDYFFKNFVSPIVQYLKYNYKYADDRTLGWDESSAPKRHIQISEPNDGETFRMFIPHKRQ